MLVLRGVDGVKWGPHKPVSRDMFTPVNPIYFKPFIGVRSKK